MLTSLSFDFVFAPLEELLNLVTLGAYHDLSTILSQYEGSTTADIIVVFATFFKWFLIIASILGVVKIIGDRLGIPVSYQVIATAGVVLLINLFIITPFETYDIIHKRVAPFFTSLQKTETLAYSPSLLGGTSMLGEYISYSSNMFKLVNANLPGNVSIPTLQQGFPTQTIDISWLSVLIDLLIVGLIVFVISKLSKKVAFVVGSVLLMSVFGVGVETMGLIISIAIAGVMLVTLMRTEYAIFAIFPAGVISILVIYLIQPPVNVLVVILTALIVVLMYPVFYLIAYFIYGTGELLEKREKLGMKKKPVRYVEEAAGEWDVAYTAFIMTLLFSSVLALYGLTFLGVGTFLTIFFALVRA